MGRRKLGGQKPCYHNWREEHHLQTSVWVIFGVGTRVWTHYPSDPFHQHFALTHEKGFSFISIFCIKMPSLGCQTMWWISYLDWVMETDRKRGTPKPGQKGVWEFLQMLFVVPLQTWKGFHTETRRSHPSDRVDTRYLLGDALGWLTLSCPVLPLQYSICHVYFFRMLRARKGKPGLHLYLQSKGFHWWIPSGPSPGCSDLRQINDYYKELVKGCPKTLAIGDESLNQPQSSDVVRSTHLWMRKRFCEPTRTLNQWSILISTENQSV